MRLSCLQLAGYSLSRLPTPALYRGPGFDWLLDGPTLMPQTDYACSGFMCY